MYRMWNFNFTQVLQPVDYSHSFYKNNFAHSSENLVKEVSATPILEGQNDGNQCYGNSQVQKYSY